MDIDTAAGQLRVHFPKGAQVVGAHEKMTDPGEIFNVFQLIKIVLKVPPAGGLRQVVRLIHRLQTLAAVRNVCTHRAAVGPSTLEAFRKAYYAAFEELTKLA